MTRKKTRPNDPCPCGSGKKLKKCCGTHGATGYTASDRELAYHMLNEIASNELGDEEDAVRELLWGRWAEQEDQLPLELHALSEGAEDAFFFFDYPLDENLYVVDLLLDDDLSAGLRTFVGTMRATAMHLYEVERTVPGVSITLRDLVEGTHITVHEKSGSKSIPRHSWVAARLVPRGPSGKPEIERGLLPISNSVREQVLQQLRTMRKDFRKNNPTADIQQFYKEMAPFFHDAFVVPILQPMIPTLANTDG
ncbi:MAG: YecA family protein, partial [Myxococcota bacterium]